MPQRGSSPLKPRPPQALLRDRVREFSQPLPAALGGSEEAVHDLRIAARRLRVAIRLLAGKPDGKRARRATTDLELVTRLAGMSRDLDVAVAIREARAHTSASGPDGRRLRTSLRASCTRARSRMGNALLDSDLAGLRRTLRRLLSRETVPTAEALRRVVAMTHEVGGLVRSGCIAAGLRYNPEELHTLRRHCRRLRYASEVAAALVGRPCEATALFKRMQDLIGDLHDLHVFSTLLTSRSASARQRGHLELAAAAAAEAQWAGETAIQRHQLLLTKGPEAIAGRALTELLALASQSQGAASDEPRRPWRRRKPSPLSGEPR